MKRVVMSVMMGLFVLFTAAGAAAAQEIPREQISIADVEKLIDQKLSEEKPLTQEELTNALLQMKDEKIANLEGNISSLVGTAGTFVTAVAAVLALVTALVVWLFQRGIDKKLDKITAIETNINDKHAEVKNKTNEIETYYKEFKEFRDNLEKVNKRLNDISDSVETAKKDYESLRGYVATIDDITNGFGVMLKFIERKNNTASIVHETKLLIERLPKNPAFTLIKLGEKVGSNFPDMDALQSHLDYLEKNLIKEESNVRKTIQSYQGVEQEHMDQDDDSELFEEAVDSAFRDWEGYLKEIEAIKELWEAHLAMSPTVEDEEITPDEPKS